ncbi:hypothetical protein Pmani_030179 [Petrolisthes manimaculis]|uniref:Sema domain-containing protein n=1 Tax=Petrolisthes manimaculis TaxID=1843537 RepID=A0AAE1NWJ3_9EUCA|nr:hypothetical protein Pmani_030179 [Petrolisthes manimaculis]
MASISLCGTNAYNPKCREYKLEEGRLSQEREYPGRGLCPFDPSHNSTAVFADGQLYVGTIADFIGLEPLIYREPLRTEQYDLSVLNSPNFVSSFALGDFVYFFFREIAVEYLNCGKTMYSRVARVCRHDKGGPQKFRNKWTSYLKSRLNCSVSGDFPFYFNEIQAATKAVEGRYGGHGTMLVYGVFTTPENSIPGSAVCAFTLQDIMDTFEGPFKGQASSNANWLPVQPTKVPEPRPGQCAIDSSTLPDVTLNFIKTHPLMDEAVPAFFGQPILISTSFHYSGRFTAIAVDPQVQTPQNKYFDVLYIGTDDGKVIKAINTRSADSYQEVAPIIIEEMAVFAPQVAVTSLQVVRPRGGRRFPRLLVASRSTIHSISMFRCYTDKILSCSECVALQDPYCAWDKTRHKCIIQQGAWSGGSGEGGSGTAAKSELIQSVSDGVHPDCGKPKKKTNEKPSHQQAVSVNSWDSGSGTPPPDHPLSDAADSVRPRSTSVPLQFTAETLAIAVASATIGALILGFITGFFCGKKCNKDDDNQLYADTDYEYFDQRQNANRGQGEVGGESEMPMVPNTIRGPQLPPQLHRHPPPPLPPLPSAPLHHHPGAGPCYQPPPDKL